MRRSEFTPESFEFGLPPGERGRPPADILHDAMRPLIDLLCRAGRLAETHRPYDHYSLLGYLIEQGLSDAAISLLGPLFNLEGRFHFSLIEWFSHWHEDVFGDLEYIDDGADTLANAFAPALMRDVRLGAEVHAIEQGPDDVVVRYRDAVGTEGSVTGDECVLTVPMVLLRHMEINGLDVDKWFTIRNVYYGRAHKIFMQFSRRWWVDDYAITHGVTVTDLAIRTWPTRRPARTRRSQERDHRVLRLGAGQHGLQHADESRGSPQALETSPRSTLRRATRSSSGSRTTGARPPRRRHRLPLPPVRDDEPFYDDIVRPVAIWVTRARPRARAVARPPRARSACARSPPTASAVPVAGPGPGELPGEVRDAHHPLRAGEQGPAPARARPRARRRG